MTADVVILAITAAAAMAIFTRWATVQKRRDVARILHEDRALAIVARWNVAACGCGWADTSPPHVRVCTHHWLRLYVAADLHQFDREMST